MECDLVKEWIPQIAIGIIVTVVGTLIADSIVRNSGHRSLFGDSHLSALARGGR
jgi:hypothetical protein